MSDLKERTLQRSFIRSSFVFAAAALACCNELQLLVFRRRCISPELPYHELAMTIPDGKSNSLVNAS